MRRVALLVLCLGPACAAAAPRLAGVLWRAQDPVALLETSAGGAWLREGEHLDGCLVTGIRPDGVLVDCGAGPLSLDLSAGPRTPVPAAVQPVVRDAVLDGSALAALAASRQAWAAAIDVAPGVSAAGVVEGWLVRGVAADGPLAGLGLRAGDLVVAVDGAPASEPAGFARALARLAEARTVEIRGRRDGVPLVIRVSLASPEPGGGAGNSPQGG